MVPLGVDAPLFRSFMTLFILGAQLVGLGLAGFGQRLLVSFRLRATSRSPIADSDSAGGTRVHDMAIQSCDIDVFEYFSCRGRCTARTNDPV